MNFMINAEGFVAVDNAVYTLPVSLAGNVSFVVWNPGSGVIQYNDRPATGVPFTDPSPYQPQLNAWLSAAAADSPPLQLAQAQGLKSVLVDSIFDVKRRSPISYNVAAGNFTWDCSDESLTQLFAVYSTWINSNITDGVNAGIVTLVNRATSANGTGIIQAYNDNLGLGTHKWTACNVSSVGAPNTSQQWIPIGQSTNVTLTGAEFVGLISAITTRRATLQTNRLALQLSISAAATIAAVVAIDVTSGWPF